jgi:hypothetical protein
MALQTVGEGLARGALCRWFQARAGLIHADLFQGQLAPLVEARSSRSAEPLPEGRDAVAGYRPVGAGAHGCGAGQAEHGADLAEIVAGLGDSEHFNSVKYRVGRAIARRGRDIGSDRLDVELALLACHWYGPAVLQPSAS